MDRRNKTPGMLSTAALSTRAILVAACVVLGSSAFLLTRDRGPDASQSAVERSAALTANRKSPEAQLVAPTRLERASAASTRASVADTAHARDQAARPSAPLALERSTFTRIRVVDRAGAPVDGANVEVWCERPGAGPGDSGEYVHGRTDSGGEFSLDGPWTHLGAVAWLGSTTSALLEQAVQARELELVLQPSRSVLGVVRDAASGRPIPDAEISVWTHARSDTVRSNVEGTFEHPRMPASGPRQQLRASAVGYAPRIGFVECDARDGTRSWSGPREAERVHGQDANAWLELELWPEAVVRGRVLGPGGEPIAGASVRAEGFAALTPESASPDTAETRTDERGEYSLHGLRPDVSHAVLVEAVPFAAQLVELAAGDDRPLDFSLAPGATIDGVVLDPSMEPAEGVTVVLKRMDAPQAAAGGAESACVRTLGRRASATTDVAGAFRFEGLGPHRYQVRVMHGGEVLLRKDVALEPAEPASLAPLLLDAQRLTLRGSVEAVNPGSPVTGSRVELYRDRLLGSVRVAADGTFKFAGLDATAPYELRWHAADGSERLLARVEAWAFEAVRLRAGGPGD